MNGLKGKIKTVKIIIGIAEFYEMSGIITSKQRIIIDFNFIGGLSRFKYAVRNEGLITELKEGLTWQLKQPN